MLTVDGLSDAHLLMAWVMLTRERLSDAYSCAAIYSQPFCADSVSATPKVARTVNQTVVAVS